MNDLPADLIYASAQLHHELTTRAATGGDQANRPPAYRAAGLSLAVASGVFIGISFVLKKVGLLKANAKYNEEAGEGYGYLKNAYWWGGMTLMIIGEICNFVAYAFVDAILVTPLGALSVVVTTVLSAIFLKERLSFVGKVGCFSCIIGSIVIVMNAPEQSAVADIQQMKAFVIAPGFLSYAGVVVLGCAAVAIWVAPKYGKKSMLVYLSICSMIGGLSVVATQGLGSAVVAQAGGKPQFNQWFLYLLLVFVVATLLTEIVYLNKALNLFNAALVTPTYYVFFTSSTIVTSAILFRGFKGTGIQIATVIMGFLVICSGVVLLQMSKSAKDVPDAAVFKGDLDQIREIGEQEQPESEPKADAIRGTAALLRRISVTRRKMEELEAERLRREKEADHLEPLRENEVVEWDGLRRRKTIIGEPGSGIPMRRQTIHPPLGMSRFPDEEPDEERPAMRDGHSFFDTVRSRARSVWVREQQGVGSTEEAKSPLAMTAIDARSGKPDTPIVPYGPGSFQEAEEHIYGLPKGLRKQQDKAAGIPAAQSPRLVQSTSSLRPNQEARRQFSFTNFLNRRSATPNERELSPAGRPRIASRASSQERRAMKNATEEERLGLVKGDSSHSLLKNASPERIQVYSPNSSVSSTHSDEDEYVYLSPPRAHQRSSRYRDPNPLPELPSDEDEKTHPSSARGPSNHSPRSLPPKHSYHRHESQPAKTGNRADPPRPPLPTYDSTATTTQTTPPLDHHYNSNIVNSHNSQYQRPPAPKHYRPSAPHITITSTTRTSSPVATNPDPKQDLIPQQVTPVAMSSDRSPTSLMKSHPYRHSHAYRNQESSLPETEPGRDSRPGRGMHREVDAGFVSHGDAEHDGNRAEIGDADADADTPKKRFEEQSKREREERRKRVSRVDS